MGTEKDKRTVLWIAPVLNHYKLQFLNRLVDRGKLEILVLHGGSLRHRGHEDSIYEATFEAVEVAATEKNFQFHWKTYYQIARLLKRSNIDYVLLPSEMKHILIILCLFILKFFCQFQFATYTHDRLAKTLPPFMSTAITKLCFALHDKVIFYTEAAMRRSVADGTVKARKAFYANNTLDTDRIWSLYSFEVNRNRSKKILFIGRLVKEKGIDTLWQYYEHLRKRNVQLVIIGDGPERQSVISAKEKYPEIEWLGSVVDEEIICEQMRRTHLVFVPGHSGLSILHSFAYGKPYVTLSNNARHPPEIDYLENRKNGLILSGETLQNVSDIVELLEDESRYERFCNQAFSTAHAMSVKNWCHQIESVLR